MPAPISFWGAAVAASARGLVEHPNARERPVRALHTASSPRPASSAGSRRSALSSDERRKPICTCALGGAGWRRQSGRRSGGTTPQSRTLQGAQGRARRSFSAQACRCRGLGRGSHRRSLAIDFGLELALVGEGHRHDRRERQARRPAATRPASSPPASQACDVIRTGGRWRARLRPPRARSRESRSSAASTRAREAQGRPGDRRHAARRPDHGAGDRPAARSRAANGRRIRRDASPI